MMQVFEEFGKYFFRPAYCCGKEPDCSKCRAKTQSRTVPKMEQVQYFHNTGKSKAEQYKDTVFVQKLRPGRPGHSGEDRPGAAFSGQNIVKHETQEELQTRIKEGHVGPQYFGGFGDLVVHRIPVHEELVGRRFHAAVMFQIDP